MTRALARPLWHQFGKSACDAGPCPRDIDEAHAAVGASDADNARGETPGVGRKQVVPDFLTVSCTGESALAEPKDGSESRSRVVPSWSADQFSDEEAFFSTEEVASLEREPSRCTFE
jgi:hypothetical protein